MYNAFGSFGKGGFFEVAASKRGDFEGRVIRDLR